MKPIRTIRVIKKGEQMSRVEEAPKAAATSAGDGLRQATRDVAGQVTSWVKEFQQRRRPDARRAFASLFADAATPLNSLS